MPGCSWQRSQCGGARTLRSRFIARRLSTTFGPSSSGVSEYEVTNCLDGGGVCASRGWLQRDLGRESLERVRPTTWHAIRGSYDPLGLELLSTPSDVTSRAVPLRGNRGVNLARTLRPIFEERDDGVHCVLLQIALAYGLAVGARECSGVNLRAARGASHELGRASFG